ncbi:MAG: UDP-N-acetylglucosamine--N-acetylmuramyl-(pentapeptide) pyrophosphoryl-undecaprenol N-acetylglucosamine transferase [Alphaproteobacteria bacterium]|nr:UDP-N-acetylglucosamine--N-acetylmuramyl-(pentapeptide) pyrophosphoryl-undecaprenol N-acetylglucosamine transferase [Alphaproteobacteria bacterium]
MKIWIATGGTGGHVFPALSVVNELVKLGHSVIISADSRVKKMITNEKNKKAKAVFIWASGVGAKKRIQQIFALFKIAVSSVFLILLFGIIRPRKLVAFGGYASVPAIFAAHVWKIPTFLHEQNAAIGRANKFALRWVKTLMTSFPTVSGISPNTNVVYTGLPVRDDFLSFAKTPLKHDMKIFVTGGSLGAQILDDIVPMAIVKLKNKKVFITHQTRPENVAKLQRFYSENKIHANVLSFVHDMANTIVNADIIIGRSGASTVIELETIGRPAILVPLNINPDQAANAESFAKNGGGFAIAQNKFSAKWLTATLDDLFDNPARLDKMAEKSYVENTAVKKIIETILK